MPRDFLNEDNYNNQEDYNRNPRDFLEENPRNNENLLTSITASPFRIGLDVARGFGNLLSNAPNYYQSAKTEIPGVLNELQNNPKGIGKQGIAGLAELGQNIFNTPHDLINYATNRLHLFPEGLNQKVQMGRMPESENEINATFGAPSEPGESLVRGLGRNAINILGAKGIASALNPMQLTSKNIVSNILKTGEKNKNVFSKEYNTLFQDANKKGFNYFPPGKNSLNIDIETLEKYSPEKNLVALKDFIKNPSNETAKKSISDLKKTTRSLEKKETLLAPEQEQYRAAKDAINKLTDNMFKNKFGEVNQNFLKKYLNTDTGYRKNVIPYTTNKSINTYKRNEMLADELVNSISKGKFMAQRGSAHPALKWRNRLEPYGKYLGFGGAAAGGIGILDYLLGRNNREIYNNSNQ